MPPLSVVLSSTTGMNIPPIKENLSPSSMSLYVVMKQFLVGAPDPLMSQFGPRATVSENLVLVHISVFFLRLLISTPHAEVAHTNNTVLIPNERNTSVGFILM